MKKFIISLALCFCMVFGLTTSATAVEKESQNPIEVCSTVPVVATVTNQETGEVKQLDASPVFVSIQPYSMSDDETTVEVGYSVDVPIPVPQTRTSSGKVNDEAGVKAQVIVEYTISANKEDIKISKLSGSWTPSSGMYMISNREAGVTNNTNRLYKQPSNNTFSYLINWGYQGFVTGPNLAAPSAWSKAVITVSGMSGTKHVIDLYFNFPDGRG